mmetsp:Transcript_30542/g.69897  ORF Transcript_30542/g.69897 Transcript_30542/m.69897 type:complete len:205 (-) Transcript_30542:697-1311(-)
MEVPHILSIILICLLSSRPLSQNFSLPLQSSRHWMVPTSFPARSSHISCAFVPAGQCAFFLICNVENNPFFLSSTAAGIPPKPESSAITCPYPHKLFVRWQTRAAVGGISLSSSFLAWGPSVSLSWFVSTSSSPKVILVSRLAAVWYSLPKGCGFCLTFSHPGHCGFKLDTMLLSTTTNQDEWNACSICVFHSSCNCHTFQNLS